MKCVTGKVCYDNKEVAEEALIQNRARNYHRDNGGPINVYECRDCGSYHFTSKGAISDFIFNSRSNIDSQREADHWERKLR